MSEFNIEEHRSKFYLKIDDYWVNNSSKSKTCLRCMDAFPEHMGEPIIVSGSIPNNIQIKKLIDFCKDEHCRNYNIKNKGRVKKERYNFGCIAPRIERVPYSTDGINRIISFCEIWFNHLRYSEYFWWIETGKDIDNPKPHIHFIWKAGKLLDTKNHSRSLRTEWNLFGGLGKITEKDEQYSKPFTNEVLLDKLGYAINSSKDTHENFRDLITNPLDGQLKAFRGCNSLTAKYRELCVNNIVDR